MRRERLDCSSLTRTSSTFAVASAVLKGFERKKSQNRPAPPVEIEGEMKARTITLAAVLLLIALSSLAATGTYRTTPRLVSADTIPTSLGLLAAFTYNPCVMCAVPGDFVFFNANWSSPLSHIATFTWDFGDGSSLVKTSNPAIGHDYFGNPGKWQVTLTVTDHQGRSDTVSQLVIFEALPTLTIQPSAPIERSFIFNATGSRSYNPTNPIKGYSWTFGDGTNATGVVVKHTYAVPGIYRVTLTLLTTNGNPQASKTVPGLIFRAIFAGLDITATGSLNINTTAQTITASITLNVANTTSDQTLFSRTFNVTIAYSATTLPSFLLVAPTGIQTLGLGCLADTKTSSEGFIVSKNPDLANQGRVNIVDIATIALSFGSTPSSPNWNSNADLNDDGSVNILDVAIAAFEYDTPAYQ